MEKTAIKEIARLLKENASGFLATVEEGRPRVRPFGFMMEEEERLYFCTNSLKNVYKQLQSVPFVEYAVTSKEMVTLRVSGEIKFCDDIQIKEKVLNVYDTVKEGYKEAGNPIFKVFYMEHGTATISDFPGQPPREIIF